MRLAFERNHPLAAELFGLNVPNDEPAYLYGRHREAVVGLLDPASEKRQPSSPSAYSSPDTRRACAA